MNAEINENDAIKLNDQQMDSPSKNPAQGTPVNH